MRAKIFYKGMIEVAVGFVVDCFYYEVGTGDYLHSFFSTIAYRLEGKSWGSKYPHLMNDLYYEEVDWKDIEKLAEELDDVEARLRSFPPEDVIWDFENPAQRPPWGDEISEQAANLAKYFANAAGETFFDILREAMKCSVQEKAALRVQSV